MENNYLNEFIDKLSTNSNIIIKETLINDVNVTLIFHKYLTDMKRFNDDFIHLINKNTINSLDKIYLGVYYRLNIDETSLLENIFTGNIILISNDLLYFVTCQNDTKRAISDSLLEPSNLLGSRDGFIENVETNINLISRRIKSTNLFFDKYTLGKRTNTSLYLIYIKDIINKETILNISNKIQNINIDSMLSLNELIYVFERENLLPTVLECGSPDVACYHILSGKAVILVDQIPICLVLPVDITSFITLKEGKHAKRYITLYSRIITFICIFFSVFFLGLYVSLIEYHTKSLSLIIISEIKSSLQGSTLPLYLEMFFLIFLFDILRQSSTKSPKISIQNVIITVGGLLIGQNAVNSGFISSFNLVVIAIAYICTYAITNNQRFITTLSIIRMILLIVSLFFGLYGYILTSIILIIIISNEKSVYVNYLSPFSPFIKDDFLKFMITSKNKKRIKREKSLKTVDKTVEVK